MVKIVQKRKTLDSRVERKSGSSEAVEFSKHQFNPFRVNVEDFFEKRETTGSLKNGENLNSQF